MTTSEPGVKHSSISAKKVEAYVETIVVGFLTDPRSIARLAGASGADKAAVHARSEASRLRTELAQAKADALDPGKPFVSWSDYTDAAQALTPQIEKWEQAAQWSGVPADIAKMGGADAVAKWKACDVHAKRRIIKALFRFTVKPAGGAGAMYACDRVAVDPLV